MVYCTVTGDYINIIKTTFDFNFDVYEAFKQHRCTKNGNKEKLSMKKASLITCEFVIKKYVLTVKF